MSARIGPVASAFRRTFRPAQAGRCVNLAIVAFTLAGIARPAAAQDTHLLVITGVGGDDEHAAQFHEWATTIIDAAKARGGLTDATITFLSDKPDQDAAHVRGRSTRENVEKAFADLAARAQPADEVFIVLIGHGSFDGRQAAAMGLVNWSTPLAALHGEVEGLARELLAKNPAALLAAKVGFRNCQGMSWDLAEDYLYAKLEQSQFLDGEGGREERLKQFLDEKSIRPGLQTYVRP